LAVTPSNSGGNAPALKTFLSGKLPILPLSADYLKAEFTANWGWKNQSSKAGTCQDSKVAGALRALPFRGTYRPFPGKTRSTHPTLPMYCGISTP
jgi:hypothetical protein